LRAGEQLLSLECCGKLYDESNTKRFVSFKKKCDITRQEATSESLQLIICKIIFSETPAPSEDAKIGSRQLKYVNGAK
jgi:hypothetical protein